MRIIDAQIHLWEGETAPPHHFRAPFGIEDALRGMDATGVHGAVNCPALWDAGSNAYAIQAAKAHPDRFATLGWFDLAMPPDEAFVTRFLAEPGMLGLRFVLFSPEDQDRLKDGALDWIWDLAHRLELPIGLMVPPPLYAEVGRIAESYPGMRLLLDHVGMGPMDKLPAAAEKLPAFLALAKHPNIALKATGVPAIATDAYPFASTHELLHRCFDAFGPARMFWGTDITRMKPNWDENRRYFMDELPWLAGDDLEAVMGRSIARWIGWT